MAASTAVAALNPAKYWESARKIVAIGRNYADHAKELGNAVPTKPFFFLKPSTSIVTKGMKLEIPTGCKELHHEVELAVIIGKKGRDIPASSAMSHVAGYSVALDMTARDWQDEVKKKGLPWSAAKGFDTSCALGEFVAQTKLADPHNVDLWLKIDGELKQSGNSKQMIFQLPQLIEHVSSIMTLEVGDIILTGTPSGVGPVKAGQTITAGIVGVGEIEFPVINKPSKAKL